MFWCRRSWRQRISAMPIPLTQREERLRTGRKAMVAELAERGRVEPTPTTTKGTEFFINICSADQKPQRTLGEPINYFSQSALLIQDYGGRGAIK